MPVPAGGERLRLEVFNSCGQRVRLLVDAPLGGGQHLISWDGLDDAGRPVSSGTYFCRAALGAANRGDGLRTRKLTLAR